MQHMLWCRWQERLLTCACMQYQASILSIDKCSCLHTFAQITLPKSQACAAPKTRLHACTQICMHAHMHRHTCTCRPHPASHHRNTDTLPGQHLHQACCLRPALGRLQPALGRLQVLDPVAPLESSELHVRGTLAECPQLWWARHA